MHDAALLEQVLGDLDIRMAILTLPAASAQSIADRLIAAGVVSLLNFAPVALSIPPHVEVRRTDLAAELQVLAFHARRAPAPTGALA